MELKKIPTPAGAAASVAGYREGLTMLMMDAGERKAGGWNANPVKMMKSETENYFHCLCSINNNCIMVGPPPPAASSSSLTSSFVLPLSSSSVSAKNACLLVRPRSQGVMK